MVKKISNPIPSEINTEFSIGQNNWDQPEHLAIGQISMEKIFPTLAIESNKTIELNYADNQLDVQALTFKDPLNPSRDIDGDSFLNRRLFNDALLVMHKGKVLHESYRNGMCKHDRHVIHSCTKSLCSMIAAMAVEEGLLNPSALTSQYIPELESIQAWDEVTIQHIWDMQAGISYSENYTQADADYWSYARAAGYYPTTDGKPALGIKAWIFDNLNRTDCPPGSAFVYNSTLTNVLGMVLENIYQQPLAQLFEEKLYNKVGAEHDAYFNTDRFGFPITEGQFNVTLQDFSRLASVIVNKGKTLDGQTLVPAGFIRDLVKPSAKLKKSYMASVQDTVFPLGQYHNQFWVLEAEKQRFTMLGIHGQFAWYDLTQDLMITGFGSFPKQDGDLMMANLKQLWNQISNAIR